MIARNLMTGLAVLLLAYAPARAQEALVAYKTLSPEVALDLARAALTDCRQRGYQAAIAVVDRFGVTQVVLRDRFAGPHTAVTATGKAWTAVSFLNLSGYIRCRCPNATLTALADLVTSDHQQPSRRYCGQ